MSRIVKGWFRRKGKNETNDSLLQVEKPQGVVFYGRGHDTKVDDASLSISVSLQVDTAPPGHGGLDKSDATQLQKPEEVQSTRECSQGTLISSTLTGPMVEPQIDKSKEIVVFMNGSFDLVHFGHMNAFRLGRSLGTRLIAGLSSGQTIAQNKGPPVWTDDERQQVVMACRFVDEIVTDVPYVLTPEYLDSLMKERSVDVLVHGDDPCLTPDGKDPYQDAKRSGMYQSIPRTEGVSSTDITGRLLALSKNVRHASNSNQIIVPIDSSYSTSVENRTEGGSGLAKTSESETTTNRLVGIFSGAMRPAPKGAKVIYVDGTWDVFHAGHVQFLERARKHGDHVVVGVYSDATVKAIRGSNYPVMNMKERLLSVLACRHVDDVLVAPSWKVTREMIDEFHISEVICGEIHDGCSVAAYSDPYEVPKQLGMFKIIKSESSLRLDLFVDRVKANRLQYEKKFAKQKVKADEYEKQKLSCLTQIPK